MKGERGWAIAILAALAALALVPLTNPGDRDRRLSPRLALLPGARPRGSLRGDRRVARNVAARAGHAGDPRRRGRGGGDGRRRGATEADGARAVDGARGDGGRALRLLP